jgi:hypothetical protein
MLICVDWSRYYRNWPTDLVIDAFFEKNNCNATGEIEFKKQLYFSQLGQALVQVRQIHEWRVTNVFVGSQPLSRCGPVYPCKHANNTGSLLLVWSIS